MEQITTKYIIVSPEDVRIKGLQTGNIIGLHSLLKREGCLDSENLFSDKQKAVALDDVQIHLANVNKTNVNASTDILLCIGNNKILLADAKFNIKNIKNISKGDIDKKLSGSMNLIEDERYHVISSLYLLFTSSILTQSHINGLKRIFLDSPKYQFMTAVEFYNMFDCKKILSN